MRIKVIFTSGVLPKKQKTLAALVWSISTRCEPCINFYVGKAKEFGVTEQELGEILSVASTMGGCVGEMWALKAFQAYRNPGHETTDPSCC